MTKPDINTIVRAHQYLYYVMAQPVISDMEYDLMCHRHGIEGGGGSDLESSYTEAEKRLGDEMLELHKDLRGY